MLKQINIQRASRIFVLVWICISTFIFSLIAVRGQAVLDVTDYGAVGDLTALDFVTTVSNSCEVDCPGANFGPGDIDKLIEVFGGGAWCGVSNQTLIAYITNVLSSTSVMVSQPAGATVSGLLGCYGTDDAPCFSNAIANAPFPQATILIPAGNYLMAPRQAITGYGPSQCHDCDLYLTRGGLTFAGQGSVILTQTGWIDAAAGGPEGERGAMFGMVSPMSDDEPVVFTNLTLFGGEAQGWIYNEIFPASPQTGIGWDMSHHAITFLYGSGGNFVSSIQVQNCAFHGWRGEVLITGYVSTNTFMTVSNCVFTDNNATALNVDFAHLWVSDLFSNMSEVEEFYRDYATMPSAMEGCTMTNVGPIALNGGYYFDPPYTISGNQFEGNGQGGAMMYTSPACDVNFISNTITAEQGPFLGTAGYQDATYGTCNSNILMAWNTFEGSGLYDNLSAFAIVGGGQDMSENIYFLSNNLANYEFIGSGYGYSTNVYCRNNQCTNVFCFSENLLSGQWFLDQSNNYDGIGVNNSQTITNIFSYQFGRLGVVQAAGTGSVIGLDDTHPAQVPTGAVMVISNAWSQTYPLYPNAHLTGVPTVLTNGMAVTFYWNGNAWVTHQ